MKDISSREAGDKLIISVPYSFKTEFKQIFKTSKWNNEAKSWEVKNTTANKNKLKNWLDGFRETTEFKDASRNLDISGANAEKLKSAFQMAGTPEGANELLKTRINLKRSIAKANAFLEKDSFKVQSEYTCFTPTPLNVMRYGTPDEVNKYFSKSNRIASPIVVEDHKSVHTPLEIAAISTRVPFENFKVLQELSNPLKKDLILYVNGKSGVLTDFAKGEKLESLINGGWDVPTQSQKRDIQIEKPIARVIKADDKLIFNIPSLAKDELRNCFKDAEWHPVNKNWSVPSNAENQKNSEAFIEILNESGAWLTDEIHKKINNVHVGAIDINKSRYDSVVIAYDEAVHNVQEINAILASKSFIETRGSKLLLEMDIEDIVMADQSDGLGLLDERLKIEPDFFNSQRYNPDGSHHTVREFLMSNHRVDADQLESFINKGMSLNDVERFSGDDFTTRSNKMLDLANNVAKFNVAFNHGAEIGRNGLALVLGNTSTAFDDLEKYTQSGYSMSQSDALTFMSNRASTAEQICDYFNKYPEFADSIETYRAAFKSNKGDLFNSIHSLYGDKINQLSFEDCYKDASHDEMWRRYKTITEYGKKVEQSDTCKGLFSISDENVQLKMIDDGYRLSEMEMKEVIGSSTMTKWGHIKKTMQQAVLNDSMQESYQEAPSRKRRM
ncbi:hypothetical protein [Stenotrophomonas acidaminiphila]